MTIFGVGHSTHTRDEFLPLVQGIDLVLDVRSHPTSRWEWWRKEQTEKWLPAAGVQYLWAPHLGGWATQDVEQYSAPMAAVGVDVRAYAHGVFPKQRIGEPRPGTGPGQPSWTNQGLYDYAWFMTTTRFRATLDQLAADYGRGSDARVALMCAEALWWKCHRSMIADALWFRHGILMRHLKPRAPKAAHISRFTDHMIGDRIARYPAAVLETLDPSVNPIEPSGPGTLGDR